MIGIGWDKIKPAGNGWLKKVGVLDFGDAVLAVGYPSGGRQRSLPAIRPTLWSAAMPSATLLIR